MAIKHRRFKLSEKREQWVKVRNQKTMKGDAIRLNERVRDRYTLEVTKLVDVMHKDVSSQIIKLFETPTAKSSIVKVNEFALDSSIASQSRILTNKLTEKWEARFNTFSYDWAKRVSGYYVSQSAKDLGRSLKKLSGGLTIDTSAISDRTRDIITASADEAGSLIKTIATDYLSAVKESVSRSITHSVSVKEMQDNIHSNLKEKYKTHKNKARNIARDQIKKTYTGLTSSRMQDAGIDKYEWRHAGGSKAPRSHHKYVLNGNIYSLSKPPVIDVKSGMRGKPGDAIHCNCIMIPVISFD